MARTFLSADEAADYLGVSSSTLRRYVSAGALKAYRLNGSRLLRFLVSDLDALMQEVVR